jgi:hypothetical protein
MAETHDEMLAPCVLVAGPSNSGKTTFLHQLDERLQQDSSRPLIHVVKGSPDATGRYLYYAPELREEVKSRAKGSWTPQAVQTICFWILNARRNLELVLVDFGGRHSPMNAAILACCTHYVVVARQFNDARQEQEEGMESWDRACQDQGLSPVARIRSLWGAGKVSVNGGECLEGTYRSDAAKPGDRTNEKTVAAVAERLLRFRLPRPALPYLDMRLDRDWKPTDLADMAGLLTELLMRAKKGRVRLGGRAPIWAYLASMHRALDYNEQSTIELFEPKWPGGFIRIPSSIAPEPAKVFAECLQVTWAGDDGRTLELTITTPDKFLPEVLALLLHAVPLPQEPPPKDGGVTVNGPAPTWIHMTYSRWLRACGVSPICVYDARSRGPVPVRPPVTTP